MHTLSTFLVTALLSMAGVGTPDVSTLAAPTSSQESSSCASFGADACLETAQCDVFPSLGATPVCGLACDMRTTAERCSSDGPCAWRDGTCQYRSSDEPLGC